MYLMNLQNIKHCNISKQAFSPVVRIGNHHPLTRRRVCPPPPLFWGRDTFAFGRGEGPNSDEGTDTGGQKTISCYSPFNAHLSIS